MTASFASCSPTAPSMISPTTSTWTILGEHIEDWSYQKFPYAKKWGGFALDLANPQGVYRTNTLARINVADKMKTPLAQAELEEFREKFGRPAHLTLLYHYARLIEMVQCAEEAVMLLEDPEITDTNIRVKIEPREARGVGCVEAPRGTLIHDYTMDSNGAHHQRQPDCGHHPQQRRHQPLRHPGGPGVNQGRHV